MPAVSLGRARRLACRRIFGGAPCSSSSHSVGVAMNSPSRSRAMMSAMTTFGSVPARCSFRRDQETSPPSASSFSVPLSAARSAPLRPKARAISRVPTFPCWRATKARISSLVGRAATRGLEVGGLERGRFTVCSARYDAKLSTATPFCHPERFTWHSTGHSWRPSLGPSLELSLGPWPCRRAWSLVWARALARTHLWPLTSPREPSLHWLPRH